MPPLSYEKRAPIRSAFFIYYQPVLVAHDQNRAFGVSRHTC